MLGAVKEFVGTIHVNPRGFGFVGREGGDVFIPKGKLAGAADGDTVEVKITGRGAAGKGPEGMVLEVLKRKREELAGVVLRMGRRGYTLFVPLLGPERLLLLEAPGKKLKRGDRVKVKVKKWGEMGLDTVCSLLEVMGHIDDPSIDVEAGIEEFSLRTEFPSEAVAEAKSFGTEVESSGERHDLRDLETVTIDPVTAKDFDDALSLRKDDKGHYHLAVHIADVTHYVRPGSALDVEARERCNSTYFPGRCVPMLPPALADNLCSLRPDVDRLAVTVMMELGPQGDLLDYEILRSVIRSQRRFSYEEAKEVLDGKLKSPHAKMLQLMVELCGNLKRVRRERGSLEFALSESVLKLDDAGVPTGTELVEYDITHQLVEEFMLKANELVATHLTKKGQALTYRVHEAPSREDLEAFSQLAAAFGKRLSPDPTPEDLQELFDAVQEKPEGYLLAVGFIRSMKMATYATDNVGHYGLSLEHYCHFTSPIRRYPDLVVHRVLFGEGPEDEEISEIARICSEQERLSAKAENSVTHLKKLRLLQSEVKKHQKQEWEAIITSVKSAGISFELKELMMDGFIHISNLGDDYYEFDAKRMVLRGRDTDEVFRCGDSATVFLQGVDLLMREAGWSLV
jgi:ribonuclease R